MRYKIVTESSTYIITESENAIVIETKQSLKDFLLDLDKSLNPRIERDELPNE